MIYIFMYCNVSNRYFLKIPYIAKDYITMWNRPNKHVLSTKIFNKKVPNSFENDICVKITKDWFFNIDLTHLGRNNKSVVL